MKNLVTIRQDKNYRLFESLRISLVRKRFSDWVKRRNSERVADGKKILKYPYLDKDSQEYISDVYIDLRSRREIICDFKTFYNKVIEPYEERRWRPEKKETKKYIKNKDHSKKEKSEQRLAKEAWRSHKGIDRDKRKADRHASGRKYWRKTERRWIRQEVRQKLKHEEYDDINTGNDRVDGWLWD